jgi:acyl carrier protein
MGIPMSNSVDGEAFLRGLEDLFQLPSGALQLSSPLENLPEWSSLAMLEFMAFAEQSYGVTPTPEGIRGCRVVEDLRVLVA